MTTNSASLSNSDDSALSDLVTMTTSNLYVSVTFGMLVYCSVRNNDTLQFILGENIYFTISKNACCIAKIYSAELNLCPQQFNNYFTNYM